MTPEPRQELQAFNELPSWGYAGTDVTEADLSLDWSVFVYSAS